MLCGADHQYPIVCSVAVTLLLAKYCSVTITCIVEYMRIASMIDYGVLLSGTASSIGYQYSLNKLL
jgi:hypothetical protein